MTYEVDVERDDTGTWMARVPEVPGVHTYGRSIQQVVRRIREALSLWVEDVDEARLIFHFRLPASAEREINRVEAARSRAATALEEAQRAVAAAVPELRRRGLSLRDIGALIGLSHQRVQQILAEEQQQVGRQLVVDFKQPTQLSRPSPKKEEQLSPAEQPIAAEVVAPSRSRV